MRVLKVRLENIKSYESGPTIEFQPGVNFISGKNGSGKTTLLESIGYCLFDHNPYSKSSKITDLIRNGHTKGIMRAWFTFDDAIVYIAERKIGKSSAWTITEEDGTQITSDPRETKRWIQKQLGLQEDYDLGKMYGQVIGVSQGEFTTFFKMPSEKGRTDHFAPILGTEDYREAFKSTSGLDSEVLQAIIEVDSRVKEIRARTEKLDEKEATVQQVADYLKAHDNEKAALESDLNTSNEALADQEKQKAEIESLEQQKKMMERETISEREKLQGIEARVAESEVAQSTVEGAKQGYELYESTMGVVKILDEKRRKKAKLEKEKGQLAESIARTEAEVQSGRKTIEEMRAKSAQLMAEEDAKITSEEGVLDQINTEIEQVIAELHIMDGLETLGGNLAERLREMRAAQSGCSTTAIEIEGLRASKASLEQEVASLPPSEQIGASIAQKNSDIADLNGKAGALTDLLKRCNASIPSGGLCPVLHESCPKMSKDALEETIRQASTESQSINSALEIHREELSKLVLAKRDCDLGDAKRVRIKELDANIEEKMNKVAQLRQVLDMGVCNQLNEEINKGFRQLGCEFQLSILTGGEQLVEEVQKSSADLQRVLKQKRQELAGQNIALTGDKASSVGRLKQSNGLIERERNNLRDMDELEVTIREKEEGLAKSRERQKALEEELAPWIRLEEEYSEAMMVMELNAAPHRSYIENKVVADKLEERKVEREQTTVKLAGLDATLRTLIEQFTSKRDAFDNDAFEALKVKVQRMRDRLMVITTEAKNKRAEKEQIEREVAEMRIQRSAIPPLEAEIATLRRTKRIVQIIREVLNKVGEPISQRYLNAISVLANQIYNSLSDERVELRWDSDYMIRLRNSRGEEREFNQLSGGEQMCAALSVQLALAKEFSGVGMAMFDEPTTNLDSQRRGFLADVIEKVRGNYGFTQLFLISHDETFSSITEQVIHLEKVDGKTTLMS